MYHGTHSAFPVHLGGLEAVSQVYVGFPESVYPGLQTNVTVGGVPLAAPVGYPLEIEG
jgi:hypothetical protein